MAKVVNENLRDAAALQLAAGSDARGAAAQLGVAPNTIYRWRTDPDFQAKVGEYRDELRERTLDLLAAKAARVDGPRPGA